MVNAKLPELIQNGTLEDALRTYFVVGQDLKPSDKFLKETGFSERGVTRHLLLGGIERIPGLADIKATIRQTCPLSKENSARALSLIDHYSANIRPITLHEETLLLQALLNLKRDNASACDVVWTPDPSNKENVPTEQAEGDVADYDFAETILLPPSPEAKGTPADFVESLLLPTLTYEA